MKTTILLTRSALVVLTLPLLGGCAGTRIRTAWDVLTGKATTVAQSDQQPGSYSTAADDSYRNAWGSAQQPAPALGTARRTSQPTRPALRDAASRVSEPAGYRMFYFANEDGSNYSSERSRQLVRVADETMKRDPFAPTAPGGATIASADRRSVPTARAYAAPDKSVADAASRLGAPRGDLQNVSLAPGAYRSAEYRRATVRTADGLVSGWARPLGFPGNDARSKLAARQALNREAGEQAVHFNDCGWAGFVADENSGIER